tara:strand:- start:927 stop:1817 length:891 start_codon:yes stop_codon:yes gene_type:complete
MNQTDVDESVKRVRALLSGVERELREIETGTYDQSADEIFSDETVIVALDLVRQRSLESATEQTLNMIIDVAMSAMSTEAGSLLLIDEDRSELTFVAVRGERADILKGRRLSAGEGIAGFVAASGQALAVSDVHESAEWDASTDEAIQFNTRNLLAVPVSGTSGVIGVLEVVNSKGRMTFSQEEIELLSGLASLAGLIIERSGASLRELVSELEQLMGGPIDVSLAQGGGGHQGDLDRKLSSITTSDSYRRAVSIAFFTAKLGSRGPRAQEMCEGVLRLLDQYLEKEDHNLENDWL